MSEPDAEAPEDFKPRQCRIHIKQIHQPNLPPVDDELAKKAGAPNLEELKKRIKQQLDTQGENEAKNAVRNKMGELLKQKYHFDLPASELKNLKTECHQVAEQEKHLFKTAEEVKAYEEKLFENSQGSLRLSFILPHLFRTFKLPEITPQEIKQRMMMSYMSEYYQSGKQMNEEEAKRMQTVSTQNLIAEKVLDYLIEQSV
jgi:trigger factor